jgi:hypothetical protein
MKPILAFLAAFLVATGATTGVKVMTTKPTAAAKADSTKEGVDSTATDSAAKGDGEHGEKPAAKDSSHSTTQTPKTGPAAPIGKAPGFSASSTLVDNGPKPTVKPAPAKQQSPATPPPADSATQASEQRLAKVFTAMEPKQAAKVLQHMQDADVQIILGYVGPRQAASIMAELPPERVATLSKMAMQTKGTK